MTEGVRSPWQDAVTRRGCAMSGMTGKFRHGPWKGCDEAVLRQVGEVP